LGGRDGEVVVDLRNLTKIAVDPKTNLAIIETGNRLGPVAVGLNNAGRATPHGTCPDVGFGGHTCRWCSTAPLSSSLLNSYLPAYGGSGYVNRQWGLALDAVRSMEVVLANGTLVTASDEENPDLYWVSSLALFFLSSC
jgi:FAD/FMN-containing dehydrogenase